MVSVYGSVFIILFLFLGVYLSFLFYHLLSINKLSDSFYQIRNVPKDTTLLFWTGGFDSTFRLCQLVLMDRKPVQPIYILSTIDNNSSIDRFKRKSSKQELEAIKKITSILRTNYSVSNELLKDIILIDDRREIDRGIEYDRTVKECMEQLYKQGRVRRPVCQYGAFSQISLSTDRTIEVAVEKDPHHSIMYNTIVLYLDSLHRLDITKLIEPSDRCLSIFRLLSFPTIDLSKKEMLELSKENGFDNILKQTWTCWYPVNDRSCNRCAMCQASPFFEKIEATT